MAGKRRKKDITEQAEQSAVQGKGSKYALQIIINFVLLFVLYQVCVYASEKWGNLLLYQIFSLAYGVAVSALVVAFYVINRGFSTEPSYPSQLPNDWSAEQKQAYLDDEARRRESAKKLLVWLFPLIVVILIDIITVFVIPFIREFLLNRSK